MNSDFIAEIKPSKSTPLLFMTQDREAMERQAVGLRYKPALMLIDDADTSAKWYYKLKAAYLVSVQTGQPPRYAESV
jgi:hypothetical protein